MKTVPQPPRIVVIGGGFGGLYATKRLGRMPVKVTLVDRRNHHLFQPLLYQVATAALSPANIAQPLRSILHRYRNVRVELADVQSVDTASKTVILSDGTIPYDYLIVAAGATDSYFGHDDWSDIAPGLKNLESATAIRSKFLLAFEVAARQTDPARRKALLTFVIVGAGPTGVELAGTMAEICHTTLASDFPDMDARLARIILLEGGPRVLPVYSEAGSASAQRQLERLGVEVRLHAMVTSMEHGAVYVGDEKIETQTVLWAAGVRGSDLGKHLGVETDRAGRVPVGSDLTLEGHPEVFVIGDLAACTDATGHKVPGVAPAAMQMGNYAAECIRGDLRKTPRKPFVYWDKGSLATIGRAAAVAEFGKFRISGFVAWLAWLVIHVYFLIGFENRLMVLWQWAWSYVSFQRAARLITYTPELHLPASSGVRASRPLGDASSSGRDARTPGDVAAQKSGRAEKQKSV